MARDRMFFLFSLALLGVVAAFLFRPSEVPSASLSASAIKGADASIEVMVAKQNLKAGSKLSPESYSWERIDDKDFSPTYIPKNPQTEKWLSEATVATNVKEGAKVQRFDIIWPQEVQHREEPVEVLQPASGKMAVPYEIPQKSGLVQFLSPGMFVDISFTSKSDIGFGTVAVTLLRNVRILAIGKEPDFTKSVVNNAGTEILLEMSPKEAEIFYYARQTGHVSLNLVESDPPAPKNELVELLMQSSSVSNFQSILVTYMMRSLFPGVHVDITATEKGYIVSGRVPDPQIAGKIMEILIKLAPGGDKAIVDLMEVNPQQVLVSVRVFEVSRDFTVKLGVNWEAIFSNHGETIAFGATYPSPSPANPNYFFNMTNVTLGNWDLSAILNMLQENDLATVLAEPNLTTVSGQTAHFFAGGEFPILIPQGGQLLGTVTVEYKQYGVLLDLTPVVDLNGLISLRIRPEISDIDKANSVVLSGFVIPALKSRYADTMVKLWPGQSYVIAGLLSDQVTDQVDSLYFLDKLPVIGPLFRSTSFEDQRTELVIIVTPFLINSERTPENVALTCNRAEERCEDGPLCVQPGVCVEPKVECCRSCPNLSTPCRMEGCQGCEQEVYTQWEE